MADILFVTSDLMFSSRVSAIAGRLGVSLSTTAAAAPPSEESASGIDSNSSSPRLLMLDLSTPGLDVSKVVPLWRMLHNPPRIIAYAPHVHIAKLDAAKAVECDTVFTKGQFDSQVETLLAQFCIKTE